MELLVVILETMGVIRSRSIRSGSFAVAKRAWR
jgi:hypothetical protein